MENNLDPNGVIFYKKMFENFNFKHIKDYDTSDIYDHIKEFKEEWSLNTTRQEKYEVHSKTNSFFIYDHSDTWKPNDKYEMTKECLDEKIIKLVSPIVKELEKIHDGKVGKTLFIKLPSGKQVDKHADGGYYLNTVRRHHIAIKTNLDVDFYVGKEKINMKVGECWEINNSRTHHVDNKGMEDRIHLLIDIIPNKFLNDSGA